MQQVTPIMPPHAGAHHPTPLDATSAEAARRDLFALDPISPESRLDALDELRPKARRGAPSRSAGAGQPTPIIEPAPKVGQNQDTNVRVGSGFNAEPFANTDQNADVPPLRHGGTKYGAPSAILIGEAGANLVLSKLQGWGIPTQVAMPGIAYDLIADIAGLDLLRIQVKTRSTAKGNSCAFNLTRGFYYSKAGIFNYGRDDFDLAAFVCLSIGAVFFCHDPKDYISVRRAWMQSSTIAQDSFDLALQAIRRRRYADQAAWLASMNDSAQAPSVADDPAQKPVSPVLRHSTTHPVEDLMPCPVPLAAPVPSPMPTLRPAAELGRMMQSSTIARDSFDLALQAIQQRRLKDQLSWLASMDDAAPAPHLTPDFAPHPVPCSAPHPTPSVPAPASVPVPTHVPVRAPKRVPLVVARREPPPIPPAIDVLDAVDWDEALATFSDDGMDAIIPI